MEQHIRDNDGRLQEEYLQRYLNLDDVFRLDRLVSLIRDRHLALLPKLLPIYDRILELQIDPLEKAATRTDLGVLYFNLGDLNNYLAQLDIALDLRKEAYGEMDPSTAAAHIHLGAVHKQNADSEESLHHMRQALE